MRLAKHAKAVAAIEAERAALDVRARRDAACAWDGPSAANAVARAACPPPPPPRHVEASPATLALVQAENERLRRRVAELDAPDALRRTPGSIFGRLCDAADL